MSGIEPLELQLDNVVGRYGERHGVGPVSARWCGAGLVWLTGSNGSGKSTLLRMVAGLKRPASGGVSWFWNGNSVSSHDMMRHRTLVAPEIQLYEELSILENFEMIARMRGLREEGSLARQALAESGLADRSDETPGSFSTGQRQRIKLTLGWLGDPAVILLDEPSTNLDAAGRQWLRTHLQTHSEKSLVLIASNVQEEWSLGGERIDLGEGVAA